MVTIGDGAISFDEKRFEAHKRRIIPHAPTMTAAADAPIRVGDKVAQLGMAIGHERLMPLVRHAVRDSDRSKHRPT